jgi:3-oxoacyl-[acyl-carrier protein] reductase
MLDILGDVLEEAAKALGKPDLILTIRADVSDPAAVQEAVQAAKEKFGRIDALVNNAGVTKFAPAHGDLDALAAEDFLRIYAINVVGPFQMLRAARPLLEASERASVLMVSSIAGVTGIGSSVAYAASKGALNTMTLSLARVLGPKIRINALCPGFIDTPWHEKGLGAEAAARVREGTKRVTPLQAASTAEDIAEAGLFFLSDASRHVTGETLLVDAGLHLGFASLSQR